MPYAITGYYGQGNGGSGVTVHDGPTFTAVAGEAAIALLYWGAGSAKVVVAAANVAQAATIKRKSRVVRAVMVVSFASGGSSECDAPAS